MNRSFAVQFAFLMYIPAMLVGAIWRLVQGIQAGVNDQFVVQYLLITAISALSGFLALRFLQYMVRRNRFGNFAYYCWGVGLISMVLFLIT